jgi:hypothetical protein
MTFGGDAPWFANAASAVLFLFGIGFLIANIKLIVDLGLYQFRRRSALLVWDGTRPRYYGFNLALGVACGLLIAFKVFVLRRPLQQLFGEGMMFVYYGYAVPMRRRIGRGFYRDGIWSESGFVPYWKIDGLRWKEGDELTLVLIDRVRRMARLLVVPLPLYGAARRLLRDRLASHEIHFAGKSLDLGEHDARDDV